MREIRKGSCAISQIPASFAAIPFQALEKAIAKGRMTNREIEITRHLATG